jgi:uncharacterized DUF497 family protein
MEYEWDPAKNRSNFAKHGVLFEYAIRAFDDPNRIDSSDDRRDYTEDRRITLGNIGGRVFAVAYTLRKDALRLISARKANPREQRQYDKTVST